MPASDNRGASKSPKKSMTWKILGGIGLGILVGLFFGEPAGRLGVLGDAYVGLLQMTVLPFVVVSLIANIGRFSLAEGRALAKVATLVLLLLFALSCLALLILPLSFPGLDTGAFFSASLLETRDPPDFLELYVPSNPFYSLASNLVPAAVLFSILLGVALAGLPHKGDLLRVLDVLIQSLIKVNGFVVRFTPVGVFAIAASAAGTMTVTEFGRLQAYLLTHTLGVLLMTFGVLPMAISVLTPLSYGKVVNASRDFLLTAWATGSLFAVLPMLVETLDRLLEGEGWGGEESHATPSVLVPLGYPFPTVGKLLALIFVPFVAWFLGRPLELGSYPLFLSAGLFSSFGSLVVTIPFLLDLLKLPSDFFNLFLMAGVWSARLGDLAGGMHLLAFTLLTIAGLTGSIRLRTGSLLRLGLPLALVTAALVGGTRSLLDYSFAGDYTRAEEVTALHRLEGGLDAEILTQPSPNPLPLDSGQDRLARMKARGVLRAGYHLDRLPFSFINEAGDLAGFDIDLLRELAADLGVGLELMPFREETLAAQLVQDHFDIAIGGLWGSLARAEAMLFTEPYLVAHAALLVADHRSEELDTLDELRRLGDRLTMAVVRGSVMETRARRFLPAAGMTVIESESEFFAMEGVDALLTTAEGGSAWTLVYPAYGVVVPIGPAPEVPIVIAVAGRDGRLAEYLNLWIDDRRSEGTLDELFDHWIRGRDESAREPRWSIGRDALGWWK